MKPQSNALWLFMGGFFLLWSVWAWLLVREPEWTQSGVLRAGVRVLIWIVPACIFARKSGSQPLLDAFALRDFKCRGLGWGLLGFAFIVALTSVGYGSQVIHLSLPSDLSTWLNPILTAPIAEEIVFRGVLLKSLLARVSMPKSLVISSALFAAIHIPYWCMAKTKSGASLLAMLGIIFVLGLLFGYLFYRSKSLWAPLSCHALNNLFSIAAGL